jgi:hypothetical protein
MDTGRFALETHADEMADLIREFPKGSRGMRKHFA